MTRSLPSDGVLILDLERLLVLKMTMSNTVSIPERGVRTYFSREGWGPGTVKGGSDSPDYSLLVPGVGDLVNGGTGGGLRTPRGVLPLTSTPSVRSLLLRPSWSSQGCQPGSVCLCVCLSTYVQMSFVDPPVLVRTSGSDTHTSVRTLLFLGPLW